MAIHPSTTEKNSQIHENNLETDRYLWVDDLRTPPEGWDWAKTYSEAVSLIGQRNYHTVSLDHDLGDVEDKTDDSLTGQCISRSETGRQEKTGYHVALYMVEHQRYPQQVRVHSMNPVGAHAILQLLQAHHPMGAGAVTRVSPY